MPKKISELQERTATCEMEYAAETYHIAYRPDVFTPRFETQLNAAQTTNNAEFCELLTRLFSDLDLLGEDDKPLPITAEALMDVPSSYLITAVKAVVGDMSPSPNSPSDSTSSF